MIWSNFQSLRNSRLLLTTVLIATTSVHSAMATNQALAQGAQLPSAAITLNDLKAESRTPSHQLAVPPNQFEIQDLNRAQHFREVYMVRLQADQAVQIDLTSKEFDALLRIYDESGQLVAEDDDGGGTTNSRIFIGSAEKRTARYYVVATAVEGRAGKFRLELLERDAPRRATKLPISADQSVNGKLEPNSPLNVQKQNVFQTYTFDAAAGDRIKLVGTSEGSSPVGIELASNGATLDKKSSELVGRSISIFRTMQQTGRYEVSVFGSPGQTIPYKLELTRLPPAQASAAPQSIAVGQEIDGAFAADSPILSDNHPYALYRLDGRAGQSLAISVAMALRQEGSSATFVQVGAETPIGFAIARTRIGRNPAPLNVKFERDGSVLIRVLGPIGSAGSYKVRVSERQPNAEPATAE